MKLRLKADARLALGSSTERPVDLVSKSQSYRLSLSTDEAAVAMLLAEEAGARQALLQRIRGQGLDWSEEELDDLLSRLDGAGALEEAPSDWLEDATDAERLAGDPMADEGPTSLYQRPDLPLPVAPVPSFLAPAAAEPPKPPSPPTGLAVAARLVCSGRHAEAADTLAPILERDPQNVQALAMLELIRAARTSALPPEGKRARPRRRRLLILVAILLPLAAGVAAGLLVTMPREVTGACQAAWIPRGELRAPMAGLLREAPPSREVRAGEAVGLIEDIEGGRRLAELRAALESDEELLSIMKTGGTDEIERSLKGLLDRLQGELARCAGACSELGSLGRRLEQAREKLRFCEWKPLPAERKAVEERVERSRREISGLAGRLRSPVTSPEAGLLVEVRPAGGRVKRGELLARLVDPRRFLVSLRLPPASVPGGTAARVSFSGRSFSQHFSGRATTPVGSAERVTVLVDAEVGKAQLGEPCQITLASGRRPLVSWLLARLRQQ